MKCRPWRAYPVEVCDALHARSALVGSPAAKHFGTLLLHQGVRKLSGTTEAQAFKEGLIGKGALEASTRILNQSIEDGKGSELTMQVSIFEFLANGTSCLSRTGSLEVDGFDKLGNAAEIVFGVCFARQSLDIDRDGRVRFLFWPVSECLGRSYFGHRRCRAYRGI